MQSKWKKEKMCFWQWNTQHFGLNLLKILSIPLTWETNTFHTHKYEFLNQLNVIAFIRLVIVNSHFDWFWWHSFILFDFSDINRNIYWVHCNQLTFKQRPNYIWSIYCSSAICRWNGAISLFLQRCNNKQIILSYHFTAVSQAQNN